jgi:hypothetical protein
MQVHMAKAVAMWALAGVMAGSVWVVQACSMVVVAPEAIQAMAVMVAPAMGLV